MTKEELIAQNKALKEEISGLKFELAQIKKLLFGSSSERFKSTFDLPGQLSFFSDEVETEQKPDQTEVIQYERKKAKKHKGRNSIPDHLPVEEVIIEPDEDTTGMVRIGEEITETLKYTPASLIKKRTIRPKYARPNGSGILIGKLPARPIEKGIAEACLLAYILVSKFVDHLPLYRQIQRFKREYGWEVSQSTMCDWVAACCTLIRPLYDKLKEEVLSCDYIQADESPIKVLDPDKPGTTHQGYQWVYDAPEPGLVLFDYRKGRGMHGPKEMLKDYRGYLQCDGYKVYDKIGRQEGITLVGCLVHARRKFYQARESDSQRSGFALSIFGQIYTIEKRIKQLGICGQAKQKMRIDQILPLMEQILGWIKAESHRVLPKSPIGKAMYYYQAQWHKLKNIFLDPKLHLDNNLIENKIRPLALGRKNYLFAGSHNGAERIAILYSFFATCKIHEVNPLEWLKDVLERIPEYPINQIGDLLPNEWKKSKELTEV